MKNIGMYEYKMSSVMAKELLREKKGDDKKLQNNAYLCKVVNEQFGIKGHCNRVIVG